MRQHGEGRLVWLVQEGCLVRLHREGRLVWLIQERHLIV
jgi:hypothetical protein